MQQIVIADTTSLLNRALFSSIPDSPYLWNVWIGPWLGQFFLDKFTWQFGYIMFAVLLPIFAMPLVGTLWWNAWRASKRGLVKESNWKNMDWSELCTSILTELDALGT